MKTVDVALKTQASLELVDRVTATEVVAVVVLVTVDVVYIGAVLIL